MRDDQAKPTRQRIFDCAVDLFAREGYSAVSIRQIARAAGITESSIYNHFPSKQAILQAIFDRFAELMQSGVIPAEDAAVYIAGCSEEEFLMLSKHSFQQYISQPELLKLWRVLAMERFRNPQANDFFKLTFIDGAIEYQTAVFQHLMELGRLPIGDARQLALEFHAYNFFLYFRCIELEPVDADPERLQYMLSQVENHVRYFNQQVGMIFER